MNIAIVEDEKIYADEVMAICKPFFEEKKIETSFAVFTSGEEFISRYERSLYTLIFMDVYMAGMNGIDTTKEVREIDPHQLLVFLTSSTEHMPEAFDCHAFQYLTKPVDKERLHKLLEDVVVVSETSAKFVKIISRRNERSLYLNDIISVVSNGHYLEIALKSGESIKSRMTVASFAQASAYDSRFILINRGILVNIDYIKELRDSACLLNNQRKFPVRVRNSAKIEQLIQDYHFDKIRKAQSRK